MYAENETKIGRVGRFKKDRREQTERANVERDGRGCGRDVKKKD